MSVESILRRKGTDVTTIGPEASIKSAADWLRAKNIGALVVTSGDAVIGLISEREIVHAFARYGEAIMDPQIRRWLIAVAIAIILFAIGMAMSISHLI
jgi:predicted transcriptional regulator